MAVDLYRLSEFQKARATQLGTTALKAFFDDPEEGELRGQWFNQEADGASVEWQRQLFIGLGVQIMNRRRPDRDFIINFIKYFVKEHFIAATDAEMQQLENEQNPTLIGSI